MNEEKLKEKIKNGKIKFITKLPEKLLQKLNETYVDLELNNAIIAANCLYSKYKEQGNNKSKYYKLKSSYIKLILPDPRNKVWGEWLKMTLSRNFIIKMVLLIKRTLNVSDIESILHF
ncbi:MAG: hypothetical protein IPH57_09995 [Saprospiraceae bacterium]|nr:hypothetical protein [Saprospiraceae bacterium]